MLQVQAIGRFTEDIKLQPITVGGKDTQVSNFVLACRDAKNTEYITCTAWNEAAITLQKNCAKGSLIFVEGKLKSSEWVDDKTQIKHKRIFINVEKFEFLNAKKKEETLNL